MSEHPVTFENLVDWLEGRLDDEAHQHVTAHLNAGCSRCQAELALLRRILAAGRAPVLSMSSALDPPPEIVAQAKRLYRSTQTPVQSSTRSGRVAWPFRCVYALAAMLIAALVGLAWLIRTPTPFAQEAMLASREGQVEAQVAESGPWTAAEQTQELREGVALRTSGGPAAVALFEGSTLNMEPGAEVRLMTLRSGLRGASYRILIEQESGSVDYAVAALRGKTSIFEVHLPNVRATLSVLGTHFGIVVRGDGVAHISVTEGYVQVASDRDHLVLQAGEELSISEAGHLAMPTESPVCSELAPAAQAFELAGQEVLPTPSMGPKPSIAPKTAQIVLPTATLTLETPVEPSAPETGQRGENYPEPDMSAPDEWPTPTMKPSQMAIAPPQGESVYVAAPAKEEPPHTCTPAPQPSRTPLPSPTAEPSATNEPTATCSATLTPTAEPSVTLVAPNTATPTRTPRPNPSPPSNLDWQGLTALRGSLVEVAWDHVMLIVTPSAESHVRIDYDDETYVWGDLDEGLEALVLARRAGDAWEAVVIIAQGEDLGWPLGFWGELGRMEWPSWFWPSMGHPAGSLGSHMR